MAELVCESCDTTFEHDKPGRRPKTCPECRGLGDPVDENENVVVESDDDLADDDVDVDDSGVEDVVEDVDDGWPQQVAAGIWLDQDGRRHADLGQAQAACERLRHG